MPIIDDFCLSYCTNVHPSEKLDQMRGSLREFTRPLKDKLFPDQPMGLGIWMAAQAAQEMHGDPEELGRFRQFLDENGFFLFSVNAFPFGDFHSRRVKEKVYHPDWTSASRREHTCRVAEVLAQLLPDGVSGSISTLAGAFRPDRHGHETSTRIALELAKTIACFRELESETGRLIQLGIEPEPWTTLELTSDVVSFFNEFVYTSGRDALASELGVDGSAAEELLRRHLGVCFDCCHQAVEFEDLKESLASLRREGIPLAKVHLSCALSVPEPGNNPDGVQQLLSFDEERYLHQVVARDPSKGLVSLRDLDELKGEVLDSWRSYPEWRCHFHVPIFLEELSHLRTTQPQLLDAIDFLRETRYCQHLEIETYTWEVIPEEIRETQCGGTLLGSLEQEFRWVMERMTEEEECRSGGVMEEEGEEKSGGKREEWGSAEIRT